MTKQLLFLLLSIGCVAQAGIEFADKTSTIRVKSGAGLNIGAGGQTVTGTIEHDTGSTINGTSLVFSGGIVNRDGTTATLTGTYDADADPGPAFLLQGSDSLDAGRNFAVNALTVSGSGNTIGGSPVFANAITLPTGVGLNCDFSAPLNKTITLDGGTVTLKADLVCANNVLINGTGSVALGGYRYALAPYYENAITGTLSFADALNFELQGRTPSNADWTFTGTNIIDGKGSTFDLRSGGSITIAAGATLVLRDMLLRGVTNSNLIFGSATSTLEVDQSSIDIAETINTTSGIVKVSGNSTFVLRNKDWNFTDNGNLTIDAAILSLNVLNNDDTAGAGTVKAPDEVYKERVRQTAAIDTNIAAGNMTMLNGAVITEMGERVGEELLGGSVSGSLVLDKSTLMSPDDVIRITSNSVINGKGSRILFARPGIPQLVIEDNVSLTIKNLELHGITDTSVQLKPGASLKIDNGVIFSLADDVTWDYEQIQLVGTDTVFEVRSIGGARQFKLESANTGGSRPHEEKYTTHLDLGTHSISLHNVFFRGLRHLKATTAVVGGVKKTGSIILAGDARVDIDTQVTDATYIIRGLGNRLRLRSDDIFFTGGLRYDGTTTSALHLEFVLPSGFHGTPQVHAKSGVIDLSSALGHAYLFSDTHSVSFVNHAADAFVLGENGFLAGNKIDIAMNPIKQTSAKVTLCPGVQLTTSLPQGAVVPDTALLDTMRSFPLGGGETRAVTAFEIREWERIGLLTQTRAIQLPNEALKPVIHYESGFTLPELAGNVRIYAEQSTRYSNFGISSSRDVNMTMQGGAEVIQSSKQTDFKASDIFNVIGGTVQHPNTLEITNDMTINGKVLLDDDAVLHIRCVLDESPPVITLGAGVQLDFGARSTLMITGKGTLKVPDGFVFDLATNGNLILADGIRLEMSNGESVTVKGKGSVLCERGGGIVVENGSALTCGTEYTDDLTVQVRTGASIRVGDAFTATTNSSYFSFRRANAELDCSQGGTLTIAEKGICEINAIAGVTDAGNMKRIDFGGSGLLYIAKGGSFQIQDNLASNPGITISLHGSQISGSGIIGVLNGVPQGQIQNNIVSTTNLTAKQIARTLTQTVPTLSNTTVFVDASNVRKVLTKNGVVVTLDSNEVVLSEDLDGGFTGYHTLTGRRFSYNSDGVRL